MEKEKNDSGGRNFDTPVDALFCRGFGGVFGVPGGVIAGVRVN